jgi:hypothetical protein
MHYYTGIQVCTVQGKPARMGRYLIPIKVKQTSHLIGPNPRKNNGFNTESKCPNFKMMCISNIVSGNVGVKAIKQIKRTASRSALYRCLVLHVTAGTSTLKNYTKLLA